MDFLPLLVQPVSWQLLRIFLVLGLSLCFEGSKEMKIETAHCFFYSFGFMSIWIHKTASFSSY